MNRMLFSVMFLTMSATATPVLSEDAQLADLFFENHLNGTIVISSLDGKSSFIHNDERAQTPYLPASTFKIPNTLIALEEKAIASEKEILKWDGKKHSYESWNKDQNLETAFAASCVWFYQELAKRIGKERYEIYLKKMHYGNELAGPEATTFWLEGDIRISAIGQIEFIKKLIDREWDFKASSYDLLGKIMLLEQTETYTLRAKTGWTARVAPEIGWIVGYVETKKGVWTFATNIDIAAPEMLNMRKEITLRALKLKGILQ